MKYRIHSSKEFCYYIYVYVHVCDIFCYKICICDFHKTHFMNGRQALGYCKPAHSAIPNSLTVT